MTKRNEIYVCEVCGNIVEVMTGSGGTLVCCGQPMTLQKENTTDASREKHVPEVEKNGDRIKVRVGSVPHPMTDAHYIEWIELIQGDRVEQKFLHPNDLPEAEFQVADGDFTVRAWCNLHGLWKNS